MITINSGGNSFIGGEHPKEAPGYGGKGKETERRKAAGAPAPQL